jgi:hypothetical protein
VTEQICRWCDGPHPSDKCPHALAAQKAYGMKPTTPTTPTSGEPCSFSPGVCNDPKCPDCGPLVDAAHPPSSGATISAEAMEAAAQFWFLQSTHRHIPSDEHIRATARLLDAFHREKVKRAMEEVEGSAPDYTTEGFKLGWSGCCHAFRALTDDGTRGREGGEGC